MAGRYRLSPAAQDPREKRTSAAAQPIRGKPKPSAEIPWILWITSLKPAPGKQGSGSKITPLLPLVS